MSKMDWPTASVIIAAITALSFNAWARRAYDKSPTVHIIRHESDDDPGDPRDPDMLLATVRDDEDELYV
jgi:hypothetical protein